MKRVSPPASRRIQPIIEILEARCLPALFPSLIFLETLAASRGFSLDGFQSNSETGDVVSTIGDINSDGIDDIAISTNPLPGANGEIYVVFGSNSSFGENFALSSLNGSNGFTIFGASNNEIRPVAAAGDVNDDGIDDLLVGGPGNDRAYVIFGKTSFAASLNVGTLGVGNGVTLVGEDFIGQFGSSVAGVGDFNGDAVDDILVGDPLAPDTHDTPSTADDESFAGKAFVIFGSSTLTSTASISVSALTGADGFELTGINEDDHAGDVVAASDVNDDGLADLLIGAPGFGTFHNNEVYVVFGATTAFAALLPLDTLTGANGFTINTTTDYGEFADFGRLAGGGDVDGDGIEDILIGAGIGAGGLAGGRAYVVYGHTGSFTASLTVDTLNGTNGFVIDGSDKNYFASGVSLGDINNDGKADIILGAPADDNFLSGSDSFHGIVYLLFGRDNFSSSFNVDSLSSSTGIEIRGFGDFGHTGGSVASAGDFNGDGSLDIIIGKPNVSPSTTEPGQAYVIFGRGGPPSAGLDAALTNVTTSGAKSYTFTVKYTDTVSVKRSSIGAGDITIDTPFVDDIAATFVKTSTTSNSPTIIATYKFTPPDGFWDFRDNGNYVVKLNAGSVLNTLDKPIGGGDLGDFDVILPFKIIAVGNNAKSPGRIGVFTPDGTKMYPDITAFAAPFAGGVRVAVGDMDGDSIPDVIAACGDGTATGTVTEIKIFDGETGAPLAGFTPIQPYGGSYTGGVYIAVGDFDGVAGNEIIVGPGIGADTNPVRVLDLVGTVLNSFHPYNDLSFTGGVRVAAGNLSGDGKVEIVTAMDSGLSRVRAFDQTLGTPLWESQPYTKDGGVFVAVGDMDPAGLAEVIVGPEGKNVPSVFVLNGTTGAKLTGKINAYPKDFRGGVRVGVQDVDNDGNLEVLVSTKNGRTVKVFNWDATNKKLVDSFGAFESTFKGGLFVAGG